MIVCRVDTLEITIVINIVIKSAIALMEMKKKAALNLHSLVWAHYRYVLGATVLCFVPGMRLPQLCFRLLHDLCSMLSCFPTELFFIYNAFTDNWTVWIWWVWQLWGVPAHERQPWCCLWLHKLQLRWVRSRSNTWTGISHFSFFSFSVFFF